MDYYNKTNTANTENRMQLQHLRLAITQDKKLYQQYTSYLAANRTASGTIRTNTETIQHIYLVNFLELSSNMPNS